MQMKSTEVTPLCNIFFEKENTVQSCSNELKSCAFIFSIELLWSHKKKKVSIYRHLLTYLNGTEGKLVNRKFRSSGKEQKCKIICTIIKKKIL